MEQSQVTERGQEVLNELADSIDFWIEVAVLDRLGIDDIDIADLRDPWNPVKFTEVEDILRDIGQDAYNAIAGLPKEEEDGKSNSETDQG